MYLYFWVGAVARTPTIALWLSISNADGGNGVCSTFCVRLRSHFNWWVVLLAARYSAGKVLVTTVLNRREHHETKLPA